jgi:malate dehydrogenase (oxaloacetate-decarboxylating)
VGYKSNSFQEQWDREYWQLTQKDTAIKKDIFLPSLKAQNWTLYDALLEKHLKDLIPTVYTPSIG